MPLSYHKHIFRTVLRYVYLDRDGKVYLVVISLK
jgi:hypothetical protein